MARARVGGTARVQFFCLTAVFAVAASSAMFTDRARFSMGGKAPGGVVYLVHFSEPYRHARHYTGWTVDLDARLAEHRAGRGARLLPPRLVSNMNRSLER